MTRIVHPKLAARHARILALIAQREGTGVVPRIVRAAEAREMVRRAEREEREGRAQQELATGTHGQK